MEIHQLRYFVAVAEESSFSHAAEREHISQPSLSQQLVDRLPRSVVLTEAGRCHLPYADTPAGDSVRSSHCVET